MHILLLNETGTWPHVGCLAVADAHARMLGSMGHEVVARRMVGTLRPLSMARSGDEAAESASIDAALSDDSLRADIQSVDAVILNAEGTIHHGAGVQWLAAIGAAQQLGRRTLIVNAVMQETPGFDRVLRSVDDLCVRDARSAAYLDSRDIPCRRVPDSLPHARFEAEPFCDLGGRIVVTDWHSARNDDVGRAMLDLWRSLPPGQRFYFPLEHAVQRLLWRAAVPTLATASLVVTGRHHGVCLAACAGVSFVALPSNTFKVEGLIEASGLPIPVCTTPADLAEGVAFAQANPGVFREFAGFVRSALPLSTFQSLSREPGLEPAVGAEREVARLAEHLRAAADRANPDFWSLGLLPGIRAAGGLG